MNRGSCLRREIVFQSNFVFFFIFISWFFESWNLKHAMILRGQYCQLGCLVCKLRYVFICNELVFFFGVGTFNYECPFLSWVTFRAKLKQLLIIF